jgi:probable rRNA maturation factor
VETLFARERALAPEERPEGVRLPAEETELSIVFCDDLFIRGLNRDYRGQDQATDVLSFAQEPIPGGTELLGDVVISVETAQTQARAARHSLAREVEWLLCHGVLHLLGYDDETEEGLERMKRRQHAVMADAGV